MRLVTPMAASARSIETTSAWLQLAWGRGSGLEEVLGPPDVGDHLPGLGELLGWGIIDDATETTGAIYTGFHPDPESVVFLVSARVVDEDKLSIDSLRALAQLPGNFLGSMQVLSLVSQGPVTQVRDRSAIVLETRSQRAIDACEHLLDHLVIGREVTKANGDCTPRSPLSVRLTRDGRVSEFREVDRAAERPVGEWKELVDWG